MRWPTPAERATIKATKFNPVGLAAVAVSLALASVSAPAKLPPPGDDAKAKK
jgi:hypothetical protein